MVSLVAAVVVVALLLAGRCSAQDHGPDENYITMNTYRTFVANPCVTLSDRSGPVGCRSEPDTWLENEAGAPDCFLLFSRSAEWWHLGPPASRHERS